MKHIVIFKDKISFGFFVKRGTTLREFKVTIKTALKNHSINIDDYELWDKKRYHILQDTDMITSDTSPSLYLHTPQEPVSPTNPWMVDVVWGGPQFDGPALDAESCAKLRLIDD